MIYKVHFIGKQYSVNAFVNEAKQYGISRAIAPSFIKDINTGDVILLARSINMRQNVAGIFGYMRVTGITPANLTNEERTKFKEMLNIESITEEGTIIKRICGHYYMENVMIIKNSIQEALEILRSIKPNVKILLNGSYHELEAFEHFPCPFTRAFTWIDTTIKEFNNGNVKANNSNSRGAMIINISDYLKAK